MESTGGRIRHIHTASQIKLTRRRRAAVRKRTAQRKRRVHLLSYNRAKDGEFSTSVQEVNDCKGFLVDDVITEPKLMTILTSADTNDTLQSIKTASVTRPPTCQRMPNIIPISVIFYLIYCHFLSLFGNHTCKYICNELTASNSMVTTVYDLLMWCCIWRNWTTNTLN